MAGRGILDLKWPEEKARIKEVQERLNKSKRIGPLEKAPGLIAGVDSAFFDDKIISVACLYSYPALEFLEESHVVRETSFPYIPGLLSFREGPAVIDAVKGLERRPELLIFDGQGIAHPRGLGIASSAGVVLGIPSIGCAKSRLLGEYKEPGAKKGSFTPLTHNGKAIGSVLRTKDSTRPLFISPGHGIDIKGSVEIVLGSCTRYRLPEPVRMADILARELKKGRV